MDTGPARGRVGSRRDRRKKAEVQSAVGVAPEVALALGASIAPLCLAGFPPWATLVTCALGGIASAVGLWVGSDDARWRRPVVLYLAIAALVWTACGLVPLPAGLLRALTAGSSPPISIEHAEVAAMLLERPAPSWLPWTASPVDTQLAVVAGAATLAFVLAALLLVARKRRRALLRAIACSTIVMALVVIAHLVVGTDEVFGFISPHATMTLPSPLVNENHLSAFFAMGAPLCFGLALTSAERTTAAGWLAAATMLAVLCIGALSRGGLLGLGVAAVVFVALGLTKRGSRERTPSRRAWMAVGIVGVAAAVAGCFWFEALSSEVQSTTLFKLRMAVRGLDLVARSPWVGVGRGGYSSAFVGIAGSDVRYEYPESFPVQWAAEWGAPFAIVLAATLVVALARVLRSAMSIERMAAVGSLVGLGAHELVDFATEMPGILVVASLLVVAALADPMEANEKRQRTAAPGARFTPWAVPALAFVLLLPGTSLLGAGISQRQSEIAAAITRRDWTEVDSLLSRALDERPGEPNFVLLGAHAHVLRGDTHALAWLNAAMRLAPHWASPHLVTSEWLAARGARAQAWLELREVERTQPFGSVPVGCTLLRSRADGEEAIRVMFDEPNGPPYLESLLENCLARDIDAAEQIDAALLRAGLPGARRRAAQTAVDAGDGAQALDLLEGIPLSDVQASFVRADALVQVGRASDAVEQLRRTPATGPAVRAQRLARLARAQAAAGDVDGMRESIGELQGEAAGRTTALADALVLQGELEGQLGNGAAAFTAYDRADAIDPTRGALARAQALALVLGETHRADLLHDRICRRSPSDAGCSPH